MACRSPSKLARSRSRRTGRSWCATGARWCSPRAWPPRAAKSRRASSPSRSSTASACTPETRSGAGAKEVPEETMLEAIAFGHAECKKLVRVQKELAAKAAKPRWLFDPAAGRDRELEARVKGLAAPKLAAALATHEKQARAGSVGRVFDEVWAALGVDESKKPIARKAFEEAESAAGPRLSVARGVRVDGRKVNEIRPISIELADLPRAHGSALFTRGETQALVSATLGTKSDEQQIEALEGETWRHFMLHYNFPSFSVGEVRRFGGPSRRDIGHGALAERAVEAGLPPQGGVPYTSRGGSALPGPNAPRANGPPAG